MKGHDKLLLREGGTTLLRRVTQRAVDTGNPVFVALPRDNTARQAEIADLPAAPVMISKHDEGMSASLRALVGALPDATPGLLVALADMPAITADDLKRLLDDFQTSGSSQVVRAAAPDGTPGNPVIIPSRLFAALARLCGDTGARHVIAREDVRLVRLPDIHAVCDIDTPEDWQRWKNSPPPG